MEIEHTTQLQELLATYRQTLIHLVNQAAVHGGETLAPPQVAAGIAQARAEIARLKATLRAAGETVDEMPIDTRTEQSETPSTGLRGQVSIKIGDGSSVGGAVIANTGTITTTYATPTAPTPLETAIAQLRAAQAAANKRGETDLAADMQPALLALEQAQQAQATGKTERYHRKLAETRSVLHTLVPADPAISETLRFIEAI